MAKLCESLREAISIGAPSYNAGRHDVCRSVYEATAKNCLSANLASPEQARILLDAIQKSAGEDVTAAAWTLRRAFDAILAGPPAPAPGPASGEDGSDDSAGPDWALADFAAEGASASGWEIVNDGVMGGLSTSALRLAPSEGLRFTGAVSFANGGGFASARSRAGAAWDCAGARGLRLHFAAADAREFKLTVRTTDQWDGPTFQAAVVPGRPGAPEVVSLPFSRFRASWRGQPVAGELTGAAVRSVGLMVSKFGVDGRPVAGFVAGAFSLTIMRICAYA